MSRPRLLDAFCCEGGAGKGYMDAGFDVTGVDLEGRVGKRYPGTFVQGDAIAYIHEHGKRFDAIHASPPCQAYSITKHTHSTEHPELVEPARAALVASGRPWVMENVVGAPLANPLVLCGSEFDSLRATDTDGRRLFLRRHRLFESNVMLFGNGGCRCAELKRQGLECGGVYGGGSSDHNHAREIRRGGYTPAKSVRATLLGGVDWMTLHGQAQSLPPVYTEHIGAQLLDHLARVAA